MSPLRKGVREFQDNVYPDMKVLFEKLDKRKEPHTLFITCADSRIDPTLITQSDPGKIFVHRNAGNIVPKYPETGSSEAASIEYAICFLGITNIVICGHSHCGAVAGLADPESIKHLPHLVNWLEHASETAAAAEQIDPDSEESMLSLVERNVIFQLEHLSSYPIVSERVASGALKLHGWVYIIKTGEVRLYQHSSGQFEPLSGSFA